MHTDFSYTNGSFSGNGLENDISSASSPPTSSSSSSSPPPSSSLSCSSSASSSSTTNAQHNNDETATALVRIPHQDSFATTVIKIEANDFDYDSWTTLAVDIYDDIFENILLGVIFDFFKQTQLRTIKMEDLSPTTEKSENKIYENPKLDIYGHSLSGIRKLECCCPNCSRSLAAFRLAPHLEKCLGMGRNSSRIASKRIAQVIKTTNGSD